MEKSQLKNDSGFTFIELLLSSMIMAFTLGATLYSFHMSSQMNYTSRNRTIATSHATFVMEEIQNTTFAQIATEIDAGTWNWNSTDINNEGLTPLNGESIAVSYTGATLLDITIVVSWTGGHGRAMNTELRTLISGG